MRFFVSFLLAILFVFPMVPTLAQDDKDPCSTAALASDIVMLATGLTVADYDGVAETSDEINGLLTDYLDNCGEAAPAGSFTIKANGAVNIRSCGETTCSIVGTSTDGQTYTVVGEDGDWYEIELDDGETGFIASWLTVKGPDEVIDIYEGYADADLVCAVQATVARGTSKDVAFAINGDGQHEVTVDLYRPNTSTPEPVWQQLPKTFIDTGEAYIHQLYRSSNFPNGTYQISLERGGVTKVLEFDLNQSGNTTIFVYCQ